MTQTNPSLHQNPVNKVAEWSVNNALEINTKKTQKTVFGSPSDSHKVSIVSRNEKLSRYLNTWLSCLTISYHGNITLNLSAKRQIIDFIFSIALGLLDRVDKLLFCFLLVIISILEYYITTWYNHSTKCKSAQRLQANLWRNSMNQPTIITY